MGHLIEKTTLIVTSSLCITIAILEALGFTSDVPWLSGNIGTITLLLLSAAILYIISAQSSTVDSLRQLRRDLSAGTEFRRFETDEEAVLFLSTLLTAARNTVDQIVIHDSTEELSEDALQQYSQNQRSFLKRKGVKFRVIMNPAHTRRQERLHELAKTFGDSRFHLRFLVDNQDSAPPLNFTIFDNEGILIRDPKPRETVGHFVYIKQPDLVKLFTAYYAGVWERAIEVAQIDIEDNDTAAIL